MSQRLTRTAGFILLPVILTMTLIAAIAFLLNRDNGMNAEMVARQMDQDRARYAAEAGLQAANARIQNLSCAGGYPVAGSPVTNNSFGSASYSAYASAATGNTTSLVSIGTYNGTSVRLTRSNVYVYQSPAKTYTLQPDGTAGIDTYLQQSSPANFGQKDKLSFSSSQSPLIKFDLSMFPSGSLPLATTMSLYGESTLATGTANIYRMVSHWNEGSGSTDPANWTTRTGSSAWTTPGGDFHPVQVASVLLAPSIWTGVDVADLAVAWSLGRYPNQGVIYRSTASFGTLGLYSSDNSDSAHRPKMDFTYLLPCGKTGPS